MNTSANQVHLYVEKYDKHEGFLLLDFVSSKEFFSFARRYDIGNDSERFPASTLLIQRASFSGRFRPQEGAVYRVPINRLWNLRWHPVAYSENSSPVIAFMLDNTLRDDLTLEQNLSGLFMQRVPAQQFAERVHRTWDSAPCGAMHLDEDIEVIVKNVGQGNWNEIRSHGYCRVVFDFGCSIHYSEAECRALLKKDPFIDHPSLIISHWDVDHYKLLAVVSDDDLRKLCCVYTPNECVSLTSKNIARRLSINCRYICPIQPGPLKKGKRKVGLKDIFYGKHYILFTGETSANKNLSGLALVVWNDEGCVFFCGDHSYQQIFEDMTLAFQALAPSWKRCHLVVPHHGGKAGSIRSSYSVNTPGKAIVSTGPNHYGHPLSSVRNALCKMGFEWIRTDFQGHDFTLTL